MHDEEEFFGEIAESAWAFSEYIDIEKQFFEDILIEASTKLDENGNHVNHNDQQLIALSRKPISMNQTLHIIQQVTPNFLLYLKAAGLQVVEEAAIRERNYLGLLQCIWIAQMRKLLIGLIFLFELNNIEVFSCLLQTLKDLLAWLHFPGELFRNMADAGQKVHGKLGLLRILNIQLENPFAILKQLRPVLFKHLFGVFYPFVAFALGVLIKLQDEQCGKHGLVIIVQMLFLVGVGQGLEYFHAEMVDILGIFF